MLPLQSQKLPRNSSTTTAHETDPIDQEQIPWLVRIELQFTHEQRGLEIVATDAIGPYSSRNGSLCVLMFIAINMLLATLVTQCPYCSAWPKSPKSRRCPRLIPPEGVCHRSISKCQGCGGEEKSGDSGGWMSFSIRSRTLFLCPSRQ